MLVRYRTTKDLTLTDFKADLDGIIQGTITQASQLSTNAKDNSVFYGTYPTGKYSRVNGTSYTYSKAHNSIAGKTHYFRLTFDSVALASFTVAKGYTSGTDTLLNTYNSNVGIAPFPYDIYYRYGVDIIVNDKMIGIFTQNGNSFSFIDIGHTGVSRAYTDSMMMAFVNLPVSTFSSNIATYTTQDPLYKTTTNAYIPYTYNLSSLSYGSLVYGFSATIPRKVVTSIGGTLSLIENPVFIDSPTSGYCSHLLYGVNKLSTNAMGGFRVYSDGSGINRFTYCDFSFLVD